MKRRIEISIFQHWWPIGSTFYFPFSCNFIIQLPKMHCCREWSALMWAVCVTRGLYGFTKITQPTSLEEKNEQFIEMKFNRKGSQAQCSFGSVLGLCPSGTAFTETESDTVAGKKGNFSKTACRPRWASHFFSYCSLHLIKAYFSSLLKQTITDAD